MSNFASKALKPRTGFGTAALIGFALLLSLATACSDRVPTPASPTPSQDSARPTSRKTPSPTTQIPPRPPSLERYGQAIQDYLTANRGTADCLFSLTTAWGMPVTPRFGLGQRCLEADTDGDGQDDIVVAVEDDRRAIDINYEGDVLIFSPVGRRYELAFSALRDLKSVFASDSPSRSLTNPALIDQPYPDIDDDGDTEFAFTWNSMGANTLRTRVFAVGLDEGSYRLLTPEGLGITYPTEIRFAIIDEVLNGVRADPSARGRPWGLVMRGDTLGSAGAGPQRAKSYSYAWTGEGFELAVKSADPSPFLYFAVLDANEAFADGKYWLAVGRYRQASVDESLLDLDPLRPFVESPAGWNRPELLAFAHLRLGLAYLRLREQDSALEAIGEALELYPEAWHGKAARVFLDTLIVASDERKACEATTAFAASNLQTFELIWEYGYGNPAFAPEDLCERPGLTNQYWSLHEWQ